MDRQNVYREGLAQHRDARGDIVPPWAKFPEYERSTIGWRMGGGESWLMYWHEFLAELDRSYEVRLAYLRRHPPAPVSWSDTVAYVLYPPPRDAARRRDDETEQLELQRRAEVLGLGLVVSDASYPIWLLQQERVRWPWEYCETPLTAARHFTRDLWFWSRQAAGLRAAGNLEVPEVPEPWRACEEPLRTGRVPAPDPRQGLLALAQMLAAGAVVPPWRLGLAVSDFADTFDTDMGFADAFRLWVMSAFDDRAHLNRCVGPDVPPEWAAWLEHQFDFE